MKAKVSAAGRLWNLHWVTPGLARSAQPLSPFWPALLTRHTIRTLINLRGRNERFAWYRREVAACARLAIAHHDVALSSRKLPQGARLIAALDLIAGAEAPVLIKCSGGADRTSLIAGLHLIDRGGAAALDAARAQCRAFPYLHLPYAGQRWIRAFFDFIETDQGADDLRVWLTARYTPERFAGFLATRGLARGYRGIAKVR